MQFYWCMSPVSRILASHMFPLNSAIRNSGINTVAITALAGFQRVDYVYSPIIYYKLYDVTLPSTKIPPHGSKDFLFI